MMVNPIRRIYYQIYLLQLENYHLRRYLGLYRQHLRGPQGPFKKPLVWTSKLLLVVVLAAVFVLAVAAAALLTGATVIALLLVLALTYTFFVSLTLAAFVLWPLDVLLKRRIVRAAKRKIASRSDITVIGITGSYGKTTMKEVLATILAEKFQVLKTPENINTPVGIARLILNDLGTDIEVFIVEMGAFRRGDIRALCALTKPDIGILTGINESHLERFGSIEDTVAAKFEIVEGMKGEGTVVLNADDALVVQYHERYLAGRSAHFFTAGQNPRSRYRAVERHLNENGSGINFRLLKDDKEVGDFAVPFLGDYIVGTIIGSIIVAQELGLTVDEIRRGIVMLKPIPHRLQPILKPNGVLVIDDSYNGNPDGAREAIKALGQFKKRRKIFVTPGFVEMGERTQEVHYTIGEQLSGVADLVVLIRNSVTPHIAQGLEGHGYLSEQVLWFDSAQEAYAEIPKMLRSGDVILFQNDWPENYS